MAEPHCQASPIYRDFTVHEPNLGIFNVAALLDLIAHPDHQYSSMDVGDRTDIGLEIVLGYIQFLIPVRPITHVHTLVLVRKLMLRTCDKRNA